MYEVLLEKTAEKDPRRLNKKIFIRIISKIKALRCDPRPRGCRKITDAKNDWRIRSGDFRIIYGIDDKNKVVRI